MATPAVLKCGHPIECGTFGECWVCAKLERATAIINAECEKIAAGDLDAVEKWANDPQISHDVLTRSCLQSLCRKLREAEEALEYWDE
jgi:hypothetical protein